MAAAPTGPGLYTEIGKKAKDLLYKDYHTDQKFTLTTYAPNGAAITLASTKKNDAIFSEIQSQLKKKNVTVDVKATSDSNLITTFTIHELGTPGLKGIFCIPFPYQNSAKAELHLSGVFGTGAFAVGADVSFDTASGDFTKYNAGLSHTTKDLTAALILNNKGDSLAASYYHKVNGTTAVGAELAHRFSNNDNTLTFGTQHALDELTTVKARLNNYGLASALVQHEWRPKSLITISTEVDTKAIDNSSKIGLSLVLKP
ncbi:hypothetical protein GUJ93_ZPchr0010g8915 [Zizania palustris]|uniref:Uncharacterized protein n=1 Tax=Zizania palustris TaxID=103762 RepID=A0A8J6BNW3_ZIZPA|nr:hypothetical protein GUJ93_ZPchr0010g8915 [Zizania palustris]